VHKDSTDSRYFPCAEACPTGALSFAAKAYTVDWLLGDMLKYQTIYRDTGGGLTISGGEPLVAANFSLALFQKAKSHYLHTAIDTSGTLAWEVLKRFLPVVDLWLYDLKHTRDPEVKSALSIANLRKLAQAGAEIWIRIPLIPDYNDSEKIWREMADIVAMVKRSVTGIYLLPYHPYGKAKYAALHRKYAMGDQDPMKSECLERAKAVFAEVLPKMTIFIGRTMAHG
jgi:pyruvate formate lyase activating enzyme